MLRRTERLPRIGFSNTKLPYGSPVAGNARISSPHFSLTYTKNASIGGLAVVVSKKVAPLSVKRHLLKRRMLSVMKPFYIKNLSCVAYARAGAGVLSFPTLKIELGDLLQRVSA